MCEEDRRPTDDAALKATRSIINRLGYLGYETLALLHSSRINHYSCIAEGLGCTLDKLAMSGVSPARKSGRRRVPNKKYSNDQYEGLEILGLDPDQGVDPELLNGNNSDDADFSAEQLAAAEEVEANDEDDLIAGDASDGSAVATPVEDAASNASLVGSEIEREPSRLKDPSGIAGYSQSAWKRKTPDTTLRSRGMPEVKSNEAKETYMKILFGSGVEDLLHVVRSRDQWAGEVSLPRRTSGDGQRGMRCSFSHTEEKRTMEATVGWDWYYERGRDLFANKQNMRFISDSEGDNYVYKPTRHSHSVLLGPYGKQKMFHLSQSEALELGEAWKAATDDVSAEPEPKSRTRERAGWILNVGTGVQWLDWAANHGGDTQYLAIATSRPQSAADKELHKASPAFTPSPPSPSSIQIWAFSAFIKPGWGGQIDSTLKPRLRLVICTEWGSVRHLKWCPMPWKSRDGESEGKISIGLLAGVWGDGCMRVLDVHMDRNCSRITSYGTQIPVKRN